MNLINTWPIKNVSTNLLYGFVCLLAASLHMQWDLPIYGTIIRMGASDFILPFMLFYLIYLKYIFKVKLNNDFKYFIIWAFLCVAWMCFSIGVTYFTAGHFSTWALKKILAWFVLTGYFVAGYFLTKLNQHENFIKYFKIAGICIGLFLFMEVFIISIMGFSYKIGIYGDWQMRWVGFLENPNAYGILNACILGLIVTSSKKDCSKLSLDSYYSMAVMLIVIFFSGSRGALMAASVSVIFLLCLKKVNLNFLKALTIAIALISSASAITTYVSLSPSAESLINKTITYNKVACYRNDSNVGVFSINKRLQSNLDAVDCWKEAPIKGIGLGNFLPKQERTGNIEPATGLPEVIHNTLLWILAEMGLLGVLIFGSLPCFYFYKTWKEVQVQPSPFMVGMLTVMVVLAAASMTTEILYQRYLWVFWGMLVGVGFKPTTNTKK